MTPSDSGCNKKFSNVLTLFTRVKIQNHIHIIREASTAKILSEILVESGSERFEIILPRISSCF